MTESFRFTYDPATLVYGRDCVAEELAVDLERLGTERALVISGTTVGTSEGTIGPVREGIGDRLSSVFAETTPDKRLRMAADAAERIREEDVDTLVALGGGSSLDVTAFAAIITAREIGYEEARAEFLDTGTVAIPDDATLLPIIVVPTTLSGADLSVVAGITTIEDGELVRGAAFDGRLMPHAIYYDPALYETTPHGVLCASAMNGFDKGVETLYSPSGSPVTDGTAIRGLRLLGRGLPNLGDGKRDEETLYDSIVGTMLVQYGFSRAIGPEAQTATVSIIHAFGHGIARGYDIQQGGAHGIIAPHVLEYLFDNTDANRRFLAEALGVDSPEATPDETAAAVVDAVSDVADALGLPERLREISDMDESDLPKIAESVHGDTLMAMKPEEVDPSVDEIEAILRAAW